MKKISLIAGIASLATVTAVLWSLPAAASPTGAVAPHNKWPARDLQTRQGDDDCDDSDDGACGGTGVPEPGSLALLVLGLGGIGYTITRRRRVKA